MATRTETDLAQNIRKATSIGTVHTFEVLSTTLLKSVS
jgi:hypothetical protein